MKFGVHVSIAGGIEKAPLRAHELGCECFQIFTRPPQGGKPSKLDSVTVEAFFAECAKYGLPDYYIHTPYYINLTSENEQTRTSSVYIIREELKRASIIGAKCVVTHIGSGKAIGRTEGIRMAVYGVQKILDDTSFSTKLLLENSAGQGEVIGDTLEELGEIIEKVGNPELGICLDTAHLFASGYDLRTEQDLDKVLRNLSAVGCSDRLKLFHGNDSKVGLGDRRDRHEHIGKGKIGIEGFRAIVNNPHLQAIDMIVETPTEGAADDIRNLKELKSLRTKGNISASQNN